MYRNIYGSISIDIACKRLVTACIACFIMLFPGAFGLQAQPANAFETTWKGSSITIPTYPVGTYDYNIYWEEEGNPGNNGSSNGHTGSTTINFGADGTYLVYIDGTFPRFYLKGIKESTERYKLKTVEQWGNISWTSMAEAFYGSWDLVINAKDTPDLSRVESLAGMFHNADGFNSDLSGWDVSNVKDMGYMFQATDEFNGNISGWDVSNVRDMSDMFNYAEAFNQDIGTWDVSGVDDMSFMFLDARTLDAANYSAILDGWSKLNTLQSSVSLARVGDDNNPTPYYSTVQSAHNKLVNTYGWDIEDGGSVPGYKLTYEGTKDGVLSGDTIQYVAAGADGTPVEVVVDKVGYALRKWSDDITDNPRTDTNIGADKTVTALVGLDTANAFVTTWTGSSVTIPTHATGNYNYNIYWEEKNNSGNNGSSSGHTGSTTINFGADGTYRVYITGDFPRIYFFSSIDENKEKIQSVEKWGNIAWTSMERAFSEARNLEVNATDAPDLSGVTSLAYMFSDAIFLNSDFSGWDVSTITNMSYMFKNARSFNSPLNWGNKTAKVEDMSFMFNDAFNFNQDISGWNVSEVKNMSSMFDGARSFNSPLNGWGSATVKVKDMSSMFNGAAAFDQDLNSWDVSEVTSMHSMFSSASVFNGDITGWQVDKVNYMDRMFASARAFNQDIGDWNVSGAIRMTGMFSQAIAFNQDISRWDVSGVTHMKDMFLNASSWDIANYSAMLDQWSDLDLLQSNVLLGTIGTSGSPTPSYSTVEAARDKLINTKGWTITDGGSVPGYKLTYKVTKHGVLSGDTIQYIAAGADGTPVEVVVDKAGFVFRKWSDDVTDNPRTDTNIGADKTVTALVELDAADAFITTWTGSSITIPTNSSETYNYSVYWENTSNSSINGLSEDLRGDAFIDFRTNGTYRVHILGTFPHFYLNNSAEAPKLQTVEQWGSIAWTSMASAFYGAENLTITAEDAPVLTNVTDMSYMFYDAEAFNQDISHWNVENVKDMSYMFYSARAFNQNIGDWDMKGIEDLSYMFYGASAFNQDIGRWDVGDVINMTKMFSGASAFNQDIGNWNVGKVNNMKGMFYDASAFNQNIGDWDVSGVLDMSEMFRNATAFNQDISGWNVGIVDYMTRMFGNASAFNQDIGDWDVSGVLDMSEMFRNAAAFNQDISGWNVVTLNYMASMFHNASAFNQDLGSWNISQVKNMYKIFTGADAFSVASYSATIDGWATLPALQQNIDLDTIGSVKNPTPYYYTVQRARDVLTEENNWTMVDGDFIKGYRLTYKSGDHATISGDTIQYQYVARRGDGTEVTVVPDTGYVFVEWSDKVTDNPRKDTNIGADSTVTALVALDTANAFITTWTASSITIPTYSGKTYDYGIYWEDTTDTSINGFSDGHTGHVTLNFPAEGTYRVYINGTFPHLYRRYSRDLTKLQTVEQWGNISWASMEYAFASAADLVVTATDAPDLSAVTDLSYMFQAAGSFNSDISHWDVSNVRDMESMFLDAVVFNQNLDKWNVSNVMDMSHMFENAKAFNQDLNSWDVGKVKDMSYMFYGASVFNGDISHWDVGEVLDMSYMFNEARVFNQDISQWDVSKVKNMELMFYVARVFNANIGHWNVSEVLNMNGMFLGAFAFNQDIGDWNVSKVADMFEMFRSARAFNQDIGGWDVSNVEVIDRMFRKAYAFNQDISGWNVSKIESMYQMFIMAYAFNQDISGWNVSNVKYMEEMFYGADAFNQDLSGWDVSNVKNMDKIFTNAHAFDVASYSATLDGWAAQGNLQQNVNLDTVGTVGNPTPYYSTAEPSRDVLTGTNSWTIIDGGSTEGYKLTYQADHATFLGDSVQYLAPGEGGTEVTLVPDPGFYLLQWSDGSTQPKRMDVNITTDTTFTAYMGMDTANAFITTWTGSAITVPTNEAETYDYAVYWEDTTDVSINGLITGQAGDATLNFPVDGIYRVYIQGTFPHFYLNYNADTAKLLTVEKWGNIAWSSMANAFKGARKLEVNATDAPILTHVTDMSNMFLGAINFDQDLSHWDVSNVTNMSGLFSGDEDFDGDDWAMTFNGNIVDWDVANVTDMSKMFFNCDDAFNQDISRWDVSRVENMSGMFFNCDAFNQDISGWDVSKVENMSGMFLAADAFDQDIGNWDVSNVSNMENMFEEADVFNQNLGSWDISNVEYIGDMFLNAHAFDVASYSATLDGWAALDEVNHDLRLGGIGSDDDLTPYYSTVQSARDTLTSIRNWTIYDGGTTAGYKLTYLADHATFLGDSVQYIAPGGSGTEVTVVPDQGFYFLNWSDGNTQNARTDIDIREDITITAYMDVDKAAPGAFITTWTGNSITIPTHPEEIYDYGIYWEDIDNPDYNGSSAGHSSDATLNFGTDGTYRVYIQGTFPHFYLKGSEDSLKLQTVEQWGNITWHSMAGAFQGAGNLVITASDAPDLSRVTDMSNMFCRATSFNQDISHWDVGNVTNMSGMFRGNSLYDVVNIGKKAMTFNQDIGNWKVGNVTDMSYMFSGASNFNQDLSGWNVGNVEDMSYMFEYATLFNHPLDGWNVGNVTDMSYMFRYAYIFNQDISGWDVGNVTNMSHMFEYNKLFNSPLNGWKVSNVKDMSYMFNDAHNFDQDLNSWDVSKVTSMEGMFYSANVFNGNIASWNVGNVKNMYRMFRYAKLFNQDIGGWDVKNVTTMKYMLSSAHKFNQDITGWDVSNVTNMEELFYRVYDFNYDISGWNVSNVTNMGSMFWHAITFNQDISAWDVSNVTEMSHMFYYADAFNQDLSAWNVSNVRKMNAMFQGTASFNQDLSAWDVGNVRKMYQMFYLTGAFNQPLDAWNVSNVNDMALMFSGAKAFNQDLSGWDVSNVSNMSKMFKDTEAFNQDISSWDVGNVNNMYEIFYGASVFNQDLSPWDVSNMTDGSSNNVYSIKMFTNTALDAANYSAILDSWAALDYLQSNQKIDTVGTVNNPTPYYSTVETSRNAIIDTYHWRLIDGGSIEGYKLTYKSDDHATISGDSVQYIARGANGTEVTAVPHPGFTFVEWSDGNTNNPRTETSITADATVTAHTVMDTANAFVTTWTGDVFSIPTSVEETYDYSIYWEEVGNETNNGVLSNNTDDVILRFDTESTYKVYINGAFPHFYLNNNEDSLKLQTVERWGSIVWGSMANAFYGAENLVINATDAPILTNVADMSGMFSHAYAFNQDISGWNVSNVTDMSRMFEGNEYNDVINGEKGMTFNQDISGWDVGKVEDMSYMFSGTLNFDQDLNGWNVANVTDMSHMFEYDTLFNSPLNNWNVGKVKDMSYMFNSTFIFNQDISGWDVGHVEHMSHMFDYDTLFNSPLNNWNVGQVKDMSGMFEDAWAFDQDLNSWDVGKVTDMEGMFYSAEVFNGNIAGWNVGNVENMSKMFRYAEAFDQAIGGWDVKNVTNMYEMFSETVAFNQDLSGWNVSNVTDMARMFEWADSFNGPLDWGDATARVENTSEMFRRAIKFNQDISGWDVGEVTNMERMFDGAVLFNQDLSGWNVSKVIDMSGMFDGATNFNNPLNWGKATAKVEDMGFMFSGTEAFNQDISGWDVSNVEDMRFMFYAADAFNQDLSGWDVSKVSKMTNVFTGAASFDAANYSAILDSWAALDGLHSNLDLDTVGVYNNPTPYYSTVESAREVLTGTYKWHIIDGGSTVGHKLVYQSDDMLKLSGDTIQYVADQANGTEVSVSGEKGFNFSGWSDGNTDNPRKDMNITHDSTVVAYAILDTANAFVTTWTGSSITIPTHPEETYDYGIYWEQVDNTANNGFSYSHKEGTTLNFNAEGTYKVYINGTFPHFYLKDSPDRLKLQTVEQWGDMVWSSMANTFYGAENLVINATDAPILTNVTDMSEMFRGATSFNQDISHWNVSNATDMSYMFSYAHLFNQDISGWNVGNVTDMSGMFRGHDLGAIRFRGKKGMNFNQDLSGWNVGKVKYMSYMFSGAFNFNQDLSGWSVGNVEDMSHMFEYDSLFNYPLGGWNVGKVKDMSYMFSYAEAFDQNLNHWDVGEVLNMEKMFLGAKNFNSRLNGWGSATSGVKNMSAMFAEAFKFDQDLSQWDVSGVENMSGMFSYAFAFNQDLSGWNVGNVTDMSGMFEEATAFNSPLNNWDVSNVTDMGKMFYSADAFNQDIGNWKVGNVTNMGGMFAGAFVFNQDIGSWAVDSVTVMARMFERARAFNQDIGSWNVSKTGSMSRMFYNADVFDQDISKWNVSNVEDMSEMFYGADAFNQDISEWNVSNVDNMSEMFAVADAFNQDISSWNVSKVTNMGWMFYGTDAFNQDLSGWDISNVNKITRMFTNAHAFDVASYSATLDGWAVLDGLHHNLNLDTVGTVGNPTPYYSTVQPARNVLTDNHSWTIIDGGSTEGYKLTYTAGDHASLLGDTIQYVAGGANAGTVAVIPDKGYAFLRWSDGDRDNPRRDRNVSADISVMANVIKDHAPKITLLGDQLMYIGAGDSYDEPGAIAIDDLDGNISDKIIISGDVDVNTEGTYLITYNVSDAAGNEATEVTRTVIVDLTAPVITLLGDNPLYVDPGDAYTEPGATATDKQDGDISDHIVISGDVVNTETEGTYIVSYDVSDSAGNAATPLERRVIVERLVTALEPENANEGMILYPNPTEGEVHIRFDHPKEIQQIILFDPEGKLLRTYTGEEARDGGVYTLDLSLYPAKIYFIEVTDQGGQRFRKRLLLK